MQTYVRYEPGIWRLAREFNVVYRPIYAGYKHDSLDNARTLPLDDPRYYHRMKYFFPVNSTDVFETFCFAGASGFGTGNPTRLVFGEGDNVGFSAWVRYNNIAAGDVFTRITVVTPRTLPTAEEYVQNVSWVRPMGERIVEGQGCPSQMMDMQGAAGREYVVQPDNIEGIYVEHLTLSVA